MARLIKRYSYSAPSIIFPSILLLSAFELQHNPVSVSYRYHVRCYLVLPSSRNSSVTPAYTSGQYGPGGS